MFLQQVIFLAALGLSATEAFTVVGRPAAWSTTSTCLQAEDSSDSVDDILNTPNFLQRKLEVLKSDIAKIEEDTIAAKELLEAGKAEWGSQFDGLRTEVSRTVFVSRDYSSHSADWDLYVM
jgi:hypothetical protein